nr:MAG TPA: hypothetical protein [Caudoviricetes sp.]
MKLHDAEIQYKCGTNSFMDSPRTLRPRLVCNSGSSPLLGYRDMLVVVGIPTVKMLN